MAFGIKWLDGDPEGTSDIFELSDLKTTGDVPRIIEHVVLKASGRPFPQPAICNVMSNGNMATLDYTAFALVNEARGYIAGHMRLSINLENAPHITRVRWRDGQAGKFEDCNFLYVQRRDKTRQLEDVLLRQQRISTVLSQLDDIALNNLLPPVGTIPERIAVTTSVFNRNQAVVVVTRRRANGQCERCGNDAPFINAATGEPYLEVHHRVPLANGGFDDLENTIALCPNCHRELHYGYA